MHHFLETLIICSKEDQFFNLELLGHILPLLEIHPDKKFFVNRRKDEAVKGDPVFLIFQSLTRLICIFVDKNPSAPEFITFASSLTNPITYENEPKEDEVEEQKKARVDIPQYTFEYLQKLSTNRKETLFFFAIPNCFSDRFAASLKAMFDNLTIQHLLTSLRHTKGQVRLHAADILNRFIAFKEVQKAAFTPQEVEKLSSALLKVLQDEGFDGQKKEEIHSEMFAVFSQLCSSDLFKSHLSITELPKLVLNNLDISRLRDCTSCLQILNSLSSNCEALFFPIFCQRILITKKKLLESIPSANSTRSPPYSSCSTSVSRNLISTSPFW